MKDERLETLSEMVRRGRPVSMDEAFEVIQYQEKLKAERKARMGWFDMLFNSTPIGMIINFFKK